MVAVPAEAWVNRNGPNPLAAAEVVAAAEIVVELDSLVGHNQTVVAVNLSGSLNGINLVAIVVVAATASANPVGHNLVAAVATLLVNLTGHSLVETTTASVSPVGHNLVVAVVVATPLDNLTGHSPVEAVVANLDGPNQDSHQDPLRIKSPCLAPHFLEKCWKKTTWET